MFFDIYLIEGIMKATELLGEIRENLKDYPIDYLRNKVTDDRYKDVTVKKLAKYNSDTWDEIFSLDIDEDYDIKDGVVNNIKEDIDFYFDNLGTIRQKMMCFWKMVNISAEAG